MQVKEVKRDNEAFDKGALRAASGERLFPKPCRSRAFDAGPKVPVMPGSGEEVGLLARGRKDVSVSESGGTDPGSTLQGCVGNEEQNERRVRESSSEDFGIGAAGSGETNSHSVPRVTLIS